jgi:hypothetical protein
MEEDKQYPYAIGEKVIGKRYPKEVEQGGIIDFIDCGELHSLLACFWNEIISQKKFAKTEAENEVKQLKELTTSLIALLNEQKEHWNAVSLAIAAEEAKHKRWLLGWLQEQDEYLELKKAVKPSRQELIKENNKLMDDHAAMIGYMNNEMGKYEEDIKALKETNRIHAETNARMSKRIMELRE